MPHQAKLSIFSLQIFLVNICNSFTRFVANLVAASVQFSYLVSLEAYLVRRPDPSTPLRFAQNDRLRWTRNDPAPNYGKGLFGAGQLHFICKWKILG